MDLRQKVPFFINYCSGYLATVTGNGSVALPKAKANGLKSVKLFGGCEQSGTPTPTVPVDIVCNNGVLTFGATTTFNTADGQGTFVTPSQSVTTRIYKSFGKLKAGKYKVKITGDFEFIFQFKDTLDVNPTQYGNIGTWATEGEYELTDENMYYGVAIRNASGTGSIYPSNFNNIGSIGYAYLDVVPVGTVETVEITGKNLLDPANIEENIATYYTDFPTNGRVGYHLSLKAGTYTFSVGSEEYATYLRYKDNAQTWSEYITIRNNGRMQTYQSDVDIAIYSGSSGNNIENMLGRNVQVEKGDTATPYEPYFNGGTATAEMLLSVGDYKDVQSVLDGAVTRNLRLIVLDGTESWSKRTDTGVNRYQSNILTNKASGAISCLCSHFQNVISFANLNDNCFIADATSRIIFDEEDITTLADWKAWLATQYANGTPVIVIYPLATPTTETVTPQTLQTQAGTNILQITQASIDNLPLEVTYKRGK